MLTEEGNIRGTDQTQEVTGWALYVDGAANSRGSGLGIVLISPTGELLEQAVKLNFDALNNEAEYEALLHGLKIARRLGADPIIKRPKDYRTSLPKVGDRHQCESSVTSMSSLDRTFH